KYGMEMLLVPLSGGRTLVETATICEATDVRARRRFGAYWSLIRVFSGVVRRDMLAGIQRKCARPGRNRTVTSVGSAAIGR
ncbi:MAG: hypothetical protein ACRDP4_07380, partial [Nocardioidaceae bacterium]